MATIAATAHEEDVGAAARLSSVYGLRYLWLALGALTWLFAVGYRWDLPSAAWIYTAFLLRFSRTSRPLPAIGLVGLVSVGNAVFAGWETAVPMNPVIALSCVAYGTVYVAPFALDRLIAPRLTPLAGLLVYPLAHTACEFFLATFSPQGASLGLLAVTQHANLPLLQVISVTGPYGVGFLIGLFATVANLAWAQAAPTAQVRRVVIGYAALLAMVVVGGEARLAFAPPKADYVRIAGISPSMPVIAHAEALLGHPVTAKSDPARTDPARERAAFGLISQELFANTHRAAQAGARVVVWSENAAVLPLSGDPGFLAQAVALARQDHIWLDVADNIPTLHDQSRLIGPDGRVLWTYQKAHPIPGLEVYTPGDGKVPTVRTPFGRLANVICYDADFPKMMRAGTDIMLVPGGDWPEIGRSHTLNMASLRAIENGYAMFRQDFNGLSAAFDHQGRVLAMQDTTTAGQHIMIADVPTRGVTTIYRMIGDTFAWLCVLVLAALVAIALLRPRRVASAVT